MQNPVNINPLILKWAREESGLTISDILPELKISSNTYNDWEKSGQNVPFKSLRSIAKLYKRQIACFFLVEIPKKKKRPKDFRNLKVFSGKLSPTTLLAIRRTHRYSEILLELNGKEYYERKTSWAKEFFEKFGSSDSIGDMEIISWIRNKINISLEDQMKYANQSQALKAWRNAIEDNLGISVFQFGMPVEEVQGFSIFEGNPYSIVINSKHSPTARIFTIFHELGHLLKKQSGLCFHDRIEKNQKIEFECNDFAGKLLIPTEALVYADSSEEIYRLSRKLKVSSEAFLLRLKSDGMIDNDLFFNLLDDIRQKVKIPSKSFGIATPVQKSINSRGNHLFSTVTDAAYNSRISFSQASDILGVKVNHLMSY